jgi:hypothetical protein
MIARFAIIVVSLLAAGSALAETMSAEAARRFVTGKLFAFNCFDGSRGAGLGMRRHASEPLPLTPGGSN